MTTDLVPSDDASASDDRNAPRLGARIPWWVTLVVLLGAALLSAGAIISKLAPTMLTNGNAMTGAARIYADYLFARNLPLALMLLFLLALRSRRMLAGYSNTCLPQIIPVIYSVNARVTRKVHIVSFSMTLHA